MPQKTIQIPNDCHDRFKADAKDCGGLKLYEMFRVYQQAWSQLTPEQQAQAIRPQLTAGDIISLIPKPKHETIACAAAKVVVSAATVNSVVEAVTEDGDITTHEKELVRKSLRALQHRIETAAALTA